MAGFKLFNLSVFLILMLPYTAAVTQQISKLSVTAEGEVTLPCENRQYPNDSCYSTTWLFSASGGHTAVTQFEYGKLHKDVKAKSHRLSVTANCSLVIKDVTYEDAGWYTCRQFRSGVQVSDSMVELPAAITTVFTQQISKFSVRVGGRVTLPCENRQYPNDSCYNTTWLFSASGGHTAVTQFEYGKLHKDVKAKSHRLSVTANCSLVIKDVTYGDAGWYNCRQFRSGVQVSDFMVELLAITGVSTIKATTSSATSSTPAISAGATSITTLTKPLTTTTTKSAVSKTTDKPPTTTNTTKPFTTATKPPTTTNATKPLTTATKPPTTTNATKSPTSTTKTPKRTNATKLPPKTTANKSHMPTTTTESLTITAATKLPTTNTTKSPIRTNETESPTVTTANKPSTTATKSPMSNITTKPPITTNATEPPTITITKSSTSTTTIKSNTTKNITQSTTATTTPKSTTITTRPESAPAKEEHISTVQYRTLLFVVAGGFAVILIMLAVIGWMLTKRNKTQKRGTLNCM